MTTARTLRQLKAILYKNLLLKRAAWKSTLAELFLPALFMAILVFIKTITSVYDSPNLAYFCGNTAPWFYSAQLDGLSTKVLQCEMKPSTCTQDSYYKSGYKLTENVSIYSQYGYTASGTDFPLYSFTIGDDSSAFEEAASMGVTLYNPSLPFAEIVQKIHSNNALLAVAPASVTSSLTYEVQNITAYFQSLVAAEDAASIMFFESETALDDYITDKNYDDENYESGKVAFAIVLNDFDVSAHQWDYSVRVNYTSSFEETDPTVACLYGSCEFTFTIPSTYFYTDDLTKPQYAGYLYGYGYSGFLTLQKTMDTYILQRETNTQVGINASVSLMATESFKTDTFQTVISSTLGIFYMLSFLFPVSRMVRGLVIEKELKIKEGMKMMGLSDAAYNASWFITLLIQMTIVSALITGVTADSVFEWSDKSYVFLYFFMFSLAIIHFCFLLASVFSKAKSAALLGPVIFFATFFPYYTVSADTYSASTKAAACLLAPTCFALGADVFANFEGGLVGVQSDNVSQMTGNFSYNLVIIMLVVDTVLYGILAWYLDQVFPSEFGTQQPWYFLFTKTYWCSVGASKEEIELESPLMDDFEQAHNDPNVEPIPQELQRQLAEKRCVQIKNIRKVFKTTGEDRVAVKGLQMEFYEGQITVLLGHNGAGKSTVISMLTGLIPSTSGDASMRGLSIRNQMRKIRMDLGVCPQHDILFPELTVMQHLTIYAAFKGLTGSAINAAAKQMIAEVGLVEKANVMASMLSGGMKRKLSVGIALIGDSKIVVLDEPTSGMDPYSRRSTWNILQRNKKGRVLLLTTHFMDEADNLGDRIAIMAHGELKCFGSSLFLKNKYGVGYTMTLVRSAGGHGEEVSALVKRYVPSADPLSNVGAELSFRLPFAAASKFVAMFREIDARKSDLGVNQYGISVTTLEEVFIKVGQNDILDEASKRETLERLKSLPDDDGHFESLPVHDDAADVQRKSLQIAMTSPPLMPRTISKNAFYDPEVGRERERLVFVTHFGALFNKRVIYGMRDKKMFCCQLVLPTLLVTLGLGLLQIRPSSKQPSLLLNGNKFNPSMSKSYRNPIPFYAESNGAVGESIQNELNNYEITAYAVPIDTDSPDQFYTCAQGAAPLLTVSNYLIDSSIPLTAEKGASRYGSMTVSANSTLSNLAYNVMVNGSAIHGPGIFVNYMHTAFLRVLTGDGAAKIKVRNAPLPSTYSEDNMSANIDAFTAALFMMIAFCFIPASYAIFVVKEREVKAKHQQIISGVSIYAYWISTYVFDILTYLVPVAVVIALINAFGIDAYTEGEGASAVFLTLLLFGPSVAAFTYLISYLFDSHSTAQNTVLFLNFITGLCLMLLSFILTLIPSTQAINVPLRYLYRLFPSFCLGDSLLQIALCDSSECPKITSSGYSTQMVSPYDWSIAGANLTFMGIEIVVFFSLTLLVEFSLTFPSILAWVHNTHDPGSGDITADEDEDVAAERQRVADGDADHDIVKLDSLRKVYSTPIGPKVAVQSLSFGIPKGECFGFLGINGAGKTTTLSILSGEFPPTSGAAFISGFDIQKDQSKIRRKIGYCPQFDALLELLTVKEHLELYARIKGVQLKYLNQVVQAKLDQMDLNDFADKAAGSLSGGNKRKLSVAIAMTGDPSIIFLDEPSTGMDPMARRFMWQVIARISTEDRTSSIILTTHSMEEAEALCTRIGIMVNGRLRCLGSSQHLKHRYGSGYEVDIKTPFTPEDYLLEKLARIRDQGLIPGTGHSNGIGNDDADALSDPGFQFHVTMSSLESFFAALGQRERIVQFAPGRSGGLLFEVMQIDGFITFLALADWWGAEDFYASVQAFMETNFSGVQLLERSTAHSFRYRILSADLPLAEVFACFEENKVQANIQNYSVGQTTLEQIFNQFASSQDNPEVAAKN